MNKDWSEKTNIRQTLSELRREVVRNVAKC